MTTSSLLDELQQLGVVFTVDGDDLRFKAPRGVMTSGRVDQLRRHKSELLNLLRGESKGNGYEPNSNGETNTAAKDARILDRFTGRLSRRGKQTENLHPYAEFVEPVKSELLARVGLDNCYVRGEGCFLFDEAGRRILDFVSQYGALPFGYNPPEIWQALEETRDQRRPNLATNSLLDGAGQLAKRLIEITPDELTHVVFSNSGAESVEVAIKLCRSATDRRGIVSTEGGFHGLTLGALSTSGNPDFKDGFGVASEDFHCVAYGDADALRRAFEQRLGFYAAFLVEPVQGEAGIIQPPDGYLADVRCICDEHDVLMIADEVQTGLGRTGKMFACERDGIVPDVMTLAKALGGGLMPIGAVLCNERAYSERFGLRHSSTMAGNAMGCYAGLASLELLTRNNNQLIHDVASNGEYLQQRLKQLQEKHPDLIQRVRGVGYLQGIVFDFSSLRDAPGLLGFLGEQQLLIHLIISYLANAERIRVAPSFMGRDVMRVEPALVAGREECDLFVDALDRTLGVLQARNTAAFLASMIGFDEARIRKLSKTQTSEVLETSEVSNAQPTPHVDGRFGFIVHLTSLNDLRQFDDTLQSFSDDELAQLKSKLVDYVDPFLIGEVQVQSQTGKRIQGQFVLVPYTPKELVEMGTDEARELIAMAVQTAADEGASVIGLGGFTSILTQGGMSLDQPNLPPITTGNSFTVAASVHAIRRTCAQQGRDMKLSTLAVLGGAGQIGQAVAMALSKEVGRLILIGSDKNPERTMRRLHDVAANISTHLRSEDLVGSGVIQLATSIEALVEADLVVTATSEVDSFIDSRHLKQSAIVCDASRPLNVHASVAEQRPDITLIEGGIIRVPGSTDFEVYAGPEPDRTFACTAETMVWALEPDKIPRELSATLDLETVAQLDTLASKHGFEVIL